MSAHSPCTAHLHGLGHGLEAFTDFDRREAQEIIPGLWLGPFGSARDQEWDLWGNRVL